MENLTSLLIGGFICFVAFMLVHEYNRLILAKYRFRFFAIRDRLRGLVINGDLSESAFEYKVAMASLNFHISCIEKASIFWLVRAMSEYNTSADQEKKFQSVKKKIDREDVRLIYVDLWCATYELLRRNSRSQVACIVLGLKLFRMFQREAPAGAKEPALNPSHALVVIKSHLSALTSVPANSSFPTSLAA